MTVHHWYRCTLALGAAFLAGCGASSSLLAVPGPANADRAARTSLHAASMRAETKTTDLLYVSRGSNEVLVYSYPGGALEGTLQLDSVSNPTGICSDRSNGNVWIMLFDSYISREFAHGGTTPIANITNPTAFAPVDCAVDPTTGTLAVVGYGYGTGTAGQVAFYPRGKTTPTVVPFPFKNTASAAYDNDGNLFVDGWGYRGGYVQEDLAELRKGATAFREISITLSSNSLRIPIRWDGTYLAVVIKAGLTRYAIHDYVAVKVGSLELRGVNFLNDVTIEGPMVATVDSFGTGAYPGVQLFHYPAGGNPIRTIAQGAFPGFGGLAVSLAQACPMNGAAVNR
jgi:hypothetical protein